MVSKELVAASSRPIILSILAKGESYGYEIIQRVRVLSDEKLQWTDGMLYPILHRLEDAGLVRSRWGRSDSGRRRRYYSITASGKRALAAELRDWTVVNSAVVRLQETVQCLS
jgi:DNA-binding PadR family transcriptional regulator